MQRLVPAPVKTAVKDARQWRRRDRFRVDPAGPWADAEVAFVWQRHELFQMAGLRLRARPRRPLRALRAGHRRVGGQRWGTKRPGWSRWLEAHGETPALEAADLVACGTAPSPNKPNVSAASQTVW